MITKTLPSGDILIVSDQDEDILSLNWIADKFKQYTYVSRTYRLNKKRHKVRIHRIIVERMIGRKLKTSEMIDHINHDTLDNTRTNLRIVTNQQNLWNKRKIKSRNNVPSTSQYRGVFWDKDAKKWVARICCSGKIYFLGRFTDEKRAAEVWNNKSIELFGQYTYLNKI